jgi:hypothetical protein
VTPADPVWQLRRDAAAILVGIWLGERIDTDGTSRFTSLPNAFIDLFATSLQK